ncbi:GntR family transcriptional regulator [Streptomyces sp. URMC 127]|uniref:GntR family transcriptional regulator n=1 Tax=Streptomyces sp. URMC 127 TaxID=3423402 RepID=UPI003F1971FE
MADRYQIAEDLRRRIGAGDWQAGEQLPAETELASLYRVSVPTLRSALELLQSEGRLDKFHGRGNFVRRPDDRTVYDSARHTSDRPPALCPALRVSVEVRRVKASADVASLLQIRAGSLLTEHEYVSTAGTSVRSVARLYVPHKVAKLGRPEAPLSPWGDNVRELLTAAGVHVASTVERVTSRLPSAEEKELFRSPAPVLAVERRSVDVTGQVVEGALLLLPGDRAEVLFTTRTHAEDREEDERTPQLDLRLLPWTSPDDKPCFLSSADGQGRLSRYADAVEAAQMDIGADVLADAEKLLANPEARCEHLRIALQQTTKSLGDVLRVAESRGGRLSASDPEEHLLSDGGDKAHRL